MTVAGGAGQVWASHYFSIIFQFLLLLLMFVVFVGLTFCDCCRRCGTSMGQSESSLTAANLTQAPTLRWTASYLVICCVVFLHWLWLRQVFGQPTQRTDEFHFLRNISLKLFHTSAHPEVNSKISSHLLLFFTLVLIKVSFWATNPKNWRISFPTKHYVCDNYLETNLNEWPRNILFTWIISGWWMFFLFYQ